LHNGTAFQNGGTSPAMVLIPAWHWIFRWTILTTVAIPAGLLLMSPLAVLLLFVANLGTKIGMWPAMSLETVEPVGFFAGLALTLSTSQWLMLRKVLPHTRSWFLVTGAGFLAAGILLVSSVSILNNFNINPSGVEIVFFLLIGVVLGLAQWMALRKMLQNAFWILVIDVLAASSFLLSGASFTSWTALIIFLMLPGLVTGIGIWILVRYSRPSLVGGERKTIPVAAERHSRKWPRILAVAMSLIPLFFLCIWLYATSQLALAKSRGIYATAEEAVIALNSQGWGGAEVVKITGVHAGPDRHDGSQPHVWFGGGTVYLDRVPQGGNRSYYPAGSFYLHVRKGWVHVPEGAFPEFIGWVMELYDLEGVNEWKAVNR